jgi:hypothetical protein
MTTIAVNLIALGVLVLAYSGISFSTQGQPVNLPGIHSETTERHVILPTAGALAIVGGIVLMLANPVRTPRAGLNSRHQ